MIHFIRKLWRNESGATAIEYALIAALIFLAIILSVSLTGNAVRNSYDDTANKVSGAMN